LYFPTGLALDAIPNADGTLSNKPEHLFIASSDFDLQFRASALAAYDLEALERLVPANCNTDADCSDGKVCDNASMDPSYFCVEDPAAPCGSVGVHQPGDQLFYPGRCASIDLSKAYPELQGSTIIEDTVEIGAFATDVIFKAHQSTGATGELEGRLFMPVRGDATLHWVDLDANGSHGHLLECGQSNTSDDSCDDNHRIGDDEDTESPNGLRQEPEPFAIAIDDPGSNVVITNQTTGSVSLYSNDFTPGIAPSLVSVLGGLPTAPVGIVAIPPPVPVPANYEPGFLAVYADAAEVDLLRVQQASSDPNDPYTPRVLTHANGVPITANSVGNDSRGIAIDDTLRKADYAACDAANCANLTADALLACEQQFASCFRAARQPNVYLSSRAPASLLVGSFIADMSQLGTSELPAFTSSIPLALGPSRIVLGRVRVATSLSSGPGVVSDPLGNYVLEQRVFVVCFDSRKIYIYDPVRQVMDAIVSTGRGPYALAIDELRGLAYIAHFTDSYLGVISLDQRFPRNYAAIVSSVGVPSAPRASK
jgi:hypothetical protein